MELCAEAAKGGTLWRMQRQLVDLESVTTCNSKFLKLAVAAAHHGQQSLDTGTANL